MCLFIYFFINVSLWILPVSAICHLFDAVTVAVFPAWWLFKFQKCSSYHFCLLQFFCFELDHVFLTAEQWYRVYILGYMVCKICMIRAKYCININNVIYLAILLETHWWILDVIWLNYYRDSGDLGNWLEMFNFRIPSNRWAFQLVSCKSSCTDLLNGFFCIHCPFLTLEYCDAVGIVFVLQLLLSS